jgi:hypothetical protein
VKYTRKEKLKIKLVSVAARGKPRDDGLLMAIKCICAAHHRRP